MTFRGRDFPNVRDIIPERQVGNWAVQHFEVTPEQSAHSALRAAHARDVWGVVPAGQYARLVHGHSVVMSDTRMERETCAEFVDAAHGRVIIGGLGLGMILPPILGKESVESVTVLELSPAVRELVEFPLRAWIDENVSPAAADKLKIRKGDVFKWRPPKGARWDMAIWDIWTDRTTDSLKDMVRLRDRWHKWVEGRQLCWFEDELKRQKRRDAGWYDDDYEDDGYY
jgi:spermidine synthase